MRIFSLTAAVCVALSAQVAFASTIAGVLTEPNARLSDNSLEVLWNSDGAGGYLPIGTGDTTLDSGDRLVTIFRIDQVTSPFPFGSTAVFGGSGWVDEFTGVAVIEVTGKSGAVGPGFSYTFGAPSTADPLGLGWTGASTAVATYSDSGNDYTGAPASIAAGITEASNGDAWWEFGFAGAGTYWTASTVSDDLSTLATLPPVQTPGSFNVGINLTALNSGPNIVGTDFTPDLFGSGNLVAGGSFPTVGGWHVLDNLDFTMQVIPEPTSALVWAGIALALGSGLRRRA